MSIQIDKGIPIPERSNGKSLIKGMDVGDSIFCENANKAKVRGQLMRRMGFRTVTRPEADGFRVWRTA